jgi:DNA-binding CsgD family transcriptional regulator
MKSANTIGDVRWRDAGAPRLTARETEVLRLLASGGAYAEIGRELHIELNTVRTHIRSIYEKLGVINRAEAVNIGWSLRLLREHDA